MKKILVQGGRPLKGEVRISGAKNAALALMPALLLAKGESTLHNVPILKDIDTMAEMMRYVGAKVDRHGTDLTVDATDFNVTEAPYDMVRRMRASTYVMGPMLGRLRRAEVSLPGGCAIGARPIDLHLRGFEALGAKIDLEQGNIIADGANLKGAEMSIEGEFGTSVGATCNVLMAAVLVPGKSIIHGCAIEPEVSDLVRMLVLMGADIEGIETGTLTVNGVEQLGPVNYSVMPDRIEAGTYLVGAAITGGDVFARGARGDQMNASLNKMAQIGLDVEIHPDGVRVKAKDGLRATNIRTLPYPGFPTDMQAQYMALLCLAEGDSIVHEGIYPDRFIHAAELMRMGANIQTARGEARVRGVKQLKGAPLMASDLRASAALVLAGLAAKGESQINRVYHIDRGYENIEGKLAALGAIIERA